MINITLKQLRYFEALAAQRHFGRAAEVAAISQPALSMQIKELEETLGTPLFERGPRHVRLTPFGEDFAGRARDILRSVEELGDMARAAQTGLSGRLRIGVIPTIAPYLLPKLIPRLALAYPDLDVHIRETQTDKLLAELDQGRIDTAVMALPASEDALTEVALFEEPFLLVRARAQASQPVPRPEDLPQMRLLLLEEGHCFRDQALSFCATRSNLPKDGLEGSSLSTLVQMVGAGIGVTLIPAMAAGVETRSADVAVSAFPDPQPARTIGMVWRKTSPIAGHLANVAGLVKEAGLA